MRTYSIFYNRMEDFMDNMAKVNKRIARYNAKVELIDIETHMETIACEDYEIADVTVEFPTFVGKDGTEYLGLAYESMGEWFYVKEDGVEEELEVKGNVCDHCGSHRHRGLYYFFRENGKVVQIGSSCVENYFGLKVDKALEILGTFEEYISDEEPTERNASKGRPLYKVNHVWLATKLATEDFTVWHKGNMKGAIASKCYDIARKEELLRQVPKMEAVQSEMDELYDSYASTSSQFADNMMKVLKDAKGNTRDYVDERSISTLGYGFFAKHKTERERVALAKERENDTSEWIGEIGDTITVSGLMSYKYSEDDAWGNEVNHYLLITDNGDRVEIKTTRDFDELFEDDAEPIRMKVTGIVGYHGGKYRKYTALKGRLKFERT